MVDWRLAGKKWITVTACSYSAFETVGTDLSLTVGIIFGLAVGAFAGVATRAYWGSSWRPIV